LPTKPQIDVRMLDPIFHFCLSLRRKNLDTPSGEMLLVPLEVKTPLGFGGQALQTAIKRE